MLPSAIGVITAFARPRFGTDALGRKQALRVVDLLTGAERVSVCDSTKLAFAQPAYNDYLVVRFLLLISSQRCTKFHAPRSTCSIWTAAPVSR
jgi:hypothetical protein